MDGSGVLAANPGRDGAARALLPAARLLVRRREVATFESLHPMQWAWYVDGGMDGVDPERVVLFDGDVRARRHRLRRHRQVRSGGVSGGALVTGAARGLGVEIARVLARRGLTVHLTDVDGDGAATAAEQLDGSAFSSALDVRDSEACRAAARATVQRAGSLAVWVNNAGVLFPGPAWEQDEAQRRLTIDVNAVGTINGTLAALEVMRAAGHGHVINVVSLAGLAAAPGEAVYSASKHAAIGFSLGTLFDLRRAGERGIDISCLCPDGIWTPMLHDKLDDAGAAASFFGTLLLPEQVAERVGDLVDAPRPAVSIPRFRGALARSFDLSPRLFMRLQAPALAMARAKQRRLKRKIEAGSWPPSRAG